MSRAHHEAGIFEADASEPDISIQGETMMNTSLNQGSAKIYQFPAGGRQALGGRRYDASKPTTDLPSQHVNNETNCSGSWYHQAAIDESKPKWER
jgi:Protein of unknown function (DUF2735)